MDGKALSIEVDDESYELKAITAYVRGEIKARDLQESLGVSRSTMYRMIDRFKQSGAAGLLSQKVGNRNRAYTTDFRTQVMALIRDRYRDFGPTLASEKLEKDHGLRISAEQLRQWMKQDGFWIDRKGRKPRVFSPRPPRERCGELIQIDGSYHRWFEKRAPDCCLINFIDDANSEIKLLRLVEHETSYSYMSCLKTYLERFGRPLSLFSDRHSIFRSTRVRADGKRTPTQFATVCGKLDIAIICAKTPQAKGRVERSHRTLQDRLVKELRLRNISTMEEANRYLEEYRVEHNERFSRDPADPENAHVPIPDVDLSVLMNYTAQRKVFKD